MIDDKTKKQIEDAGKLFDKIVSGDSKIVALSNAIRENDAKEFDPAATLENFNTSLDDDIERYNTVTNKMLKLRNKK